MMKPFTQKQPCWMEIALQLKEARANEAVAQGLTKKLKNALVSIDETSKSVKKVSDECLEHSLVGSVADMTQALHTTTETINAFSTMLRSTLLGDAKVSKHLSDLEEADIPSGPQDLDADSVLAQSASCFLREGVREMWSSNKMTAIIAGITSAGSIVVLVKFIWKFLKYIFKGVGWTWRKIFPKPKPEDVEAQSSTENGPRWMVTLISTLVALVVAYFGGKFAATKYVMASAADKWGGRLYAMCAAFLGVERNVSSFIGKIFEWFHNFVVWIYEHLVQGDKVKVVSMMQKRQDQIARWVREVQYLDSYKVRNLIRTDPALCHRVNIVSATAQIIKTNMASLGLAYPELDDKKQRHGLLQIADQAMKLKDEMDLDHMCGVNRSPPMNMIFVGDTDVGKTAVSKLFARRVLSKAAMGTNNGYEAIGDVYTRNTSVSYWNGAQANMKVVIFDEVLNWNNSSDEGANNYLSESFGVCNSAVFNVPMAELGEKKLCIAPKFVVQTANSFNSVALEKIVSNMNAFWRRFDFFVEVRKLREAKSIEERAVFGNLTFRVYTHGKPSKPDLNGSYLEMDFSELCNWFAQRLNEKYLNDLKYRATQEHMIYGDIEETFFTPNAPFRFPDLTKDTYIPCALHYIYGLPIETRRRIYSEIAKCEKANQNFYGELPTILKKFGYKLGSHAALELKQIITREGLMPDAILDVWAIPEAQSAQAQGEAGDEARLVEESAKLTELSSSDGVVAGPSSSSGCDNKEFSHLEGTTVPKTSTEVYSHGETLGRVSDGVSESCIHAEVYDSARNRLFTRPKIEVSGDSSFLVLHTMAVACKRIFGSKCLSEDKFDLREPYAKCVKIVQKEGEECIVKVAIDTPCVQNCVVGTRVEHFRYWVKMESIFPDWMEFTARFPKRLHGLLNGGLATGVYRTTTEDVENGGFFKKLKDYICSKTFLVITGIISALAAGLGIYLSVRSPALGPEAESLSSRDGRSLQKSAALPLSSFKRPDKVVAAQSTELEEGVVSKIAANHARVELVTNGNTKHSGTVLFLRGTTAIAPRHYFDHCGTNFENVREMILKYQTKAGLKIQKLVVENGRSDVEQIAIVGVPSLVILEFGAHVLPMRPNIVHLFCTEEELRQSRRQVTILESLFVERTVRLAFHHTTVSLDGLVAVKQTSDHEQFAVVATLKHGVSRQGLCGSLMLNDRSRVMGIHVAGLPTGETGYAEGVCRELLEEVLAECEEPLEVMDADATRILPVFRDLFMGEGPVGQMESERASLESGPSESISANAVSDSADVGRHDVVAVAPTLTIVSKSELGRNPTVSEMSDRMIPISSVSWKTDQGTDSLLVELDVLKELFTNNKNAPQMMPLRGHRYARFELRIRVVPNSSARSSGGCLVSWTYAAGQDPFFNSHKRSFKSRCQALSAFIDAGACNEVELYIPFKYIKDFFDVGLHHGKFGAGNYGMLLVNVVNQLAVSDHSTTKAGITIFAALENVELKAPMHVEIVEAQMLSAMAIAADVYKTYMTNRDKPPEMPTSVKIKTTVCDQMAMGKGIPDSSYPLRLEPAMLPETSAGLETKKDFLKAIYGYVDTVEWKEGDESGKLLAAFPCKPQSTKVGAHIPTPVGFLAAVDSYWRGDLVYKIQVVCPVELTGRLLVALVFKQGRDFEYNKAKVGPHVIIDINGSGEYEVRVPFVSDLNFFPTFDCGDPRTTPSTLCFFAMNSLMSNVSIASSVRMNIYVKGAENFETIVPRNATLVPGYLYSSDPSKSAIPVKVGYQPVYVGTWHSTPVTGMPMLRYGPTSDHVTQFEADAVPKGVAAFWELDASCKAVMRHNSIDVEVTHILCFKSDQYIYAMAYPNKKSVDMDVVRCGRGEALSGYMKVTESSKWWSAMVGKMYQTVDKCVFVASTVEAQGEVSLGDAVSSTDYGRSFTGESHSDLKDYLRRFSYVTSKKASLPANSMVPIWRIPVLPQGGLEMSRSRKDPSVSTVPDAISNDLIAVISSAFAFVKGGMRYKILVDSESECDVWVSHQPYARPATDVITSSFTDTTEHYYISEKAIYKEGEAAMVFPQNTSVEVEVPFYSSVTRHYAGCLRGADETDIAFRSLGYLSVSVSTRLESTVNMRILQSVADDWDLEVFQGFPRCKHARRNGYVKVVKPKKTLQFSSGRSTPSSFETVGQGEVEHYSRYEYEYYGPVSPELVATMPSKTSFTKTRGHGVLFPSVKEPSILSSYDERWEYAVSPLMAGVGHHLSPLAPLDMTVARECVSDYRELIMAKCQPQLVDMRVLTIDEAVVGIPGLEGYRGLDMSSSAGFYYRNQPGTGKGAFLSVKDGKVVDIAMDLQRQMIAEKTLRDRGVICPTVFVDCLKDELISKEKVRKFGKTRIFSMSPLNYTLRAKCVFQHFAASFQVCRFDLEHAVGINPDSAEWARLASALHGVKDPVFVEGDYSKFGDRLPSFLVQAAYDIIIEWSGKHIVNFPVKEARALAYESCFALHLAGQELYRVLCGQPSGNPLTVVINSMVNSMLVRYAWKKCARGAYAGFDRFHREVRFFVYGDDLIMGVSRRVAEFFNAGKMSEVFRTFGLVFTDSSKGESIRPFLSFGEITFLKRGFLKHPTRPCQFLAPLDKVSILECALWRPRTFDDSADAEMAKDAVRLSYSHGPDYYKFVSSAVKTFFASLGERVVFPTWQELDCRVFEQGEVLFDMATGNATKF